MVIFESGQDTFNAAIDNGSIVGIDKNGYKQI